MTGLHGMTVSFNGVWDISQKEECPPTKSLDFFKKSLNRRAFYYLDLHYILD